ncbi:hypothetical protein [Methylobacillus sp. Pita1]|uniref:hypothetical protein n=1 Tax=Methylobacillus sp. Pita1 TaxID=3382642 RepID=UPI0038B4A471
MRAAFVLMINGKYVGSNGRGGLELVDSIDEAERLTSYAEAFIVASHWFLDDWQIIEVAPKHPPDSGSGFGPSGLAS